MSKNAVPGESEGGEKCYRANWRQRVCPGNYIFDINHVRTAAMHRGILFETRPVCTTATKRGHFFFPFKTNAFFLSFTRLFLCCFSLFVFSTLFILRGLLANACAKFDSSTHSRKNVVENIARFTWNFSNETKKKGKIGEAKVSLNDYLILPE